MKLTVEMAVESYDKLLGKCGAPSPEFETLINGCIERRGTQDHLQNFMQILCEKEQAKTLLRTAVDLCPEAVPAITKALASANDQ